MAATLAAAAWASFPALGGGRGARTEDLRLIAGGGKVGGLARDYLDSGSDADAEIARLFAAWGDRINAVRQADASFDDDGFMAAYRAEREHRRAIWTAEARTLRGLQMRAMAFLSDGAGLFGSYADAAREADSRRPMGRDSNTVTAYPDHAFAAYSFARDLLRLAEADPNGPRYPEVVPIQLASEHN